MSRKSGKGDGRPSSRARARSKTPRSTARLRLYTPQPPAPETGSSEGDDVSPLELYRVEKARRARAMTSDSRLEEAKAEYQALLAADAAKGKGGRPRKKPAPPTSVSPVAVQGDTFNHAEEADDVELDTTDEFEGGDEEASEPEEHDEAS